MDCHDARLLLTLQRREPDALDAVERDALQRHVSGCSACQTWNQGETRFDSAVTTAIKNVPLPMGLKNKIAVRLHASPAPRGKAWIATAAAVLLAVGIGTGAYVWLQPASVNPYEFIAFDQPRDEESVREFFASQKHSMTAPPQFDYGYLLRCEFAYFRGKRVPRLTFQSEHNGRTVTAHVYCLPKNQFRIDDTENESLSRHRIQVWTGENENYVVDCSGDVSLMLRATS